MSTHKALHKHAWLVVTLQSSSSYDADIQCLNNSTGKFKKWTSGGQSEPQWLIPRATLTWAFTEMCSWEEPWHKEWQDVYLYRVPLASSHKEQKTKILAFFWNYTEIRMHTHTLELYLAATGLDYGPQRGLQALFQILATDYSFYPLWQSYNVPILILGMKRPKSGKGYITCRLSQLVGWKRNSLLSDCSLRDASSLLDILGLYPK